MFRIRIPLNGAGSSILGSIPIRIQGYRTKNQGCDPKWLVSDPTPDSHTTFKEVSAQDPVSDLVSDPATLVLVFVSSLCTFCPPGSGSGFRIRIRIHWHDWIRTRISFRGFLWSCLYYLRYGIIVIFTSVFQDKMPIRSHNTVEISSVEKLFCLLMEGFLKITDPDSGSPKNM